MPGFGCLISKRFPEDETGDLGMRKFIGALAMTLILCLLVGIPMAPEAHAATKYWIGVDITNQVTTVYRTSDNGVVKQMLCSTGLDATPTPTGTFYMPKKAYSSERTEWYYFSEFQCYAKYASRIKGGILFHSVIYSSRSDSSLRTSSVRNLGKKASHGCIRLSVANAKWIAENCLAGTKVKIYYGTYDPDLRQQLTGSYQTLKLGSSGSSVKKLQTRLKECGWYSGSISGKYDSATESAVKAFQKAQGLTVDGKAGSKTQSALYGSNPAKGNVTTAPTATPAPTQAAIGTATVKTGGSVLNMRTKASTSASVATRLKNGAKVEVLESGATWTKVRSGSKTGYVMTKYLKITLSGAATTLPAWTTATPAVTATPTPTPAPTQAAIGTATVKTGGSYLNMRTKASTSASVETRLKNGAKVEVLEDNGTWLKVRSGSKTGYVMAKYLKVTLNNGSIAATAAPTATATATPKPTVIGTATVKTSGSYLSLRAGKSTSSTLKAKIPNKTKVEIISDEGTWVKVLYKDKTGYVMAKYLKKTSTAATAAPTATPTLPAWTTAPTATPAPAATATPTAAPTATPTAAPTATPTAAPTATPTPDPTPTPAPTATPTPAPTATPAPADTTDADADDGATE